MYDYLIFQTAIKSDCCTASIVDKQPTHLKKPVHSLHSTQHAVLSTNSVDHRVECYTVGDRNFDSAGNYMPIVIAYQSQASIATLEQLRFSWLGFNMSKQC